ncbi:MAG UNVERIFIED_CONTAM: toll/interleukin-1 receptor domain-containing protein [Anaerolineae bacterium]
MPCPCPYVSYSSAIAIAPPTYPKRIGFPEHLREECFPNTDIPRYDVWQDKHSLPRATPHWWDEIVKAIEACDVLIFALSEDSLNSPFCLAELDYAYRRCRPIVPVVLEGEHVRVAGKHDVKQSLKAKIPDVVEQSSIHLR